jgi:hypothetical protein
MGVIDLILLHRTRRQEGKYGQALPHQDTCQLICYQHHNQTNMNQTRMRMEQKFSDFPASRKTKYTNIILQNENGFFTKVETERCFQTKKTQKQNFFFRLMQIFLFHASFA